MSTRIRVWCPDCDGNPDLDPGQIHALAVCDRDGQMTVASSFGFECPSCGEAINRPANERVIGLLQVGGVVIEEVMVEPGSSHPLTATPRPPALTEDDLHDAQQRLANDNWFDQLLAVIAEDAEPPTDDDPGVC